MNETELRQHIGNLQAVFVRDVFQGAIPSLAAQLASIESLQQLAGGNLDAAKTLRTDLRREVEAYLARVKENPFFRTVDEVARSLVGATFVYTPSLAGVEAGMITQVAAYTGDGFDLNFREPGTLGIWRSSQRGGYGVACIAAHAQGQEGYVAVLAARTSSGALGMNKFVERAGLETLAGQNVADSSSPLRFVLRDLSQNLPGNLAVKSLPTKGKGKGCLAVYEVY
jgi:hypothetical protein